MSPECGPTAISLDSIRPGPSLRVGGLNDAHVAALAEVSEGWPPIVVTEDNVLVDGHHRVAAAQQLGLDRIAAVVFKGSRADAYVEAVRSNISHGMPLTLSERRRAGAQILAVHPTWSDRRIAGCCGLSAKTIKRLRDESGVVGGLSIGWRREDRARRSRPTGRRRRRAGEHRRRARAVSRRVPAHDRRFGRCIAGDGPQRAEPVASRPGESERSARGWRRTVTRPPVSPHETRRPSGHGRRGFRIHVP